MVESQKLYKVTIKNENGMKIPNVPPYIEGEHIWSYLSRLALSNGFCDTNHFLNRLLLDETDSRWKRFRKMQYDVPTDRLEIISVEGFQEWIAESTLYSFMLPFMGLSEQGNRIRRYAEPYHLKQSMLYSTAPLVRRLRICPECLKEDQQEGMIHLHLIHQVPGLEICPIHGCALAEFEGDHGMELSRLDLYSPVSPHDDAESYAAFCLSLSKQHPSTNLHVLKERLKVYVPDMSSWVHETRQTLSQIDPVQAIRTISSHVDGIDGFIASLESPSHQELVKEDIVGRFEIVSKYSDAFVIARCLKCGHSFPATPLSLIAGYGCPKCEEGMTRDELFFSMFSHVSKGEWVLNSDFSGLTSHIRARHMESGFEASTFAWCFLYKDLLPPSISIEARAARWKKRVTGQNVMTHKRNERIKRAVESSGEFELIDITGEITSLRLKLRHMICGETFWVFWNNFHAYPHCRNCQIKGRWNEHDIASQIAEVSNGVFHWCGDVASKQWMASDGIRTICSDGLPRLISRIRRLCEFGDERRDLSSLYRTIDVHIAERKGQVIFLEDMYPLYNEKKVISSYCSRLLKEGRIESSETGIYWHSGELHSVDEVIYRKFCDRYGTLNGVPICDSLFSFWIADGKPCRHMVATQPRGATPPYHLEMRRKVLDTPLGTTQSPVSIDKDNAKIIAFIMTIKYAKYISCWNVERQEQLKRWAVRNDINSSAIWQFAETFSKKLLLKCTKFLKGGLSDG